MKRIILLSTLANLLIFGNHFGYSQSNVGISKGTTPDASALLDVDATGMTPKGMLIPRIALTSIVDTATIASPANALVVYNTNATMTNGNGVGFYYYCRTNCATKGWKFMSAADNGPGNPGQVLTSQGASAPVQWTTPTIQSGSGGATGCAGCVTQLSNNQGLVTWNACRNACAAMGAGWRIPTWNELTFIASGGMGIPSGGWITGNWIWSASPQEFTGSSTYWGYYMTIDESTGNWRYDASTTTNNCRCVK